MRKTLGKPSLASIPGSNPEWSHAQFLLYIIAAGLCVVGFSWQVGGQFEKLRQGSTTISRRTLKSPDGKIQMPSLTICTTPGFKESVLQNMGLHPKAWDIYWLYTKPNRFEMYWPNDTKSWNLSTFHETEIFEKIGLVDPRIGDTYLNVSEETFNEIFSLQTVNTYGGKCFTLRIKKDIDDYNYLNIVFKNLTLSSGKNMISTYHFLIHSHYQDESIATKTWRLEQPRVFHVPVFSTGEFIIETTKIKDSVTKCESEGYKDYRSCLKNFVEKVVKNQRSPCQFQMLPFYSENTFFGLPYCNNGSLAEKVFKAMVAAEKNYSECAAPCEIYEYKVTERIYASASETEYDETNVWILMGTTDISLIEEILLFDFSSIVAGVGGSLGLFIGFSFLDLFRVIINKIKL